MLPLHIPDHVHYRVADHGGSVLLNVRSGQWHAMNPAANTMWQAWCRTGDFDAAVQAVATDYPHTSSDRIRDDAQQLASALATRGLVVLGRETGSPKVPRHERDRHGEPVLAVTAAPGLRRRPVATVAFGIALLLLKLPFSTIVRVISGTRARWCRQTATTTQVAAAVIEVQRAARWYPGRAACLELSLATVVAMTLLRRRVDWVIGVADDPYRFHAWVETDGVPVIDGSNTEFNVFRRVLTI